MMRRLWIVAMSAALALTAQAGLADEAAPAAQAPIDITPPAAIPSDLPPAAEPQPAPADVPPQTSPAVEAPAQSGPSPAVGSASASPQATPAPTPAFAPAPAPAPVLTEAPAPAAAAKSDSFLGTWVLDTSKNASGEASPLKSETIALTDLGGGRWKSVTDQLTTSGNTMHSEVTFAFDGKDYSPVATPPVPAGAPHFAESFTRVGPDTIKIALKLDGKPAGSLINQVSADGKTLTLTGTGSAEDEPTLLGVFVRKGDAPIPSTPMAAAPSSSEGIAGATTAAPSR